MFLIVWTDGVGQAPTNNARLFAIRVALDGNQLDGRPLDLGTGKTPSVASDGYAFMVACARTLENPVWPYTAVFARIVTNQGDLEREQSVTPPGFYGFEPKATWSGNTYVVVARSQPPSHGSLIYTRRVATNGVPLEPVVNVTGDLHTSAVNSVAATTTESVILTKGNNNLQEFDAFGINRFVVDETGAVSHGKALPSSFWFAVFDGREYALTTAPATALTWPFIAVADRGFIHIVSTVRRHTAAAR